MKSLRQEIMEAKTQPEIDELLNKGRGYRFASSKSRNRWRSAAKKRWAELK